MSDERGQKYQEFSSSERKHSHHSEHQHKKKVKRTFRKKKIPLSLTANEPLTAAGIPKFLQHAYINGLPPPCIPELRKWQQDLITSSDWKAGKSSIVLVPTSGGKTVAADVAIAQQLDKDPVSKAIYALPFVALASEKFAEYTQRFFSFTVRAFYQNVGGPDFRRGQIAICTYEKAHTLLNAAISGGYANKIKLVVIDEVHLIGDEGRGAVIEALILKLRLLKHSPRIIGLTATVSASDAVRISHWIGGFPYISSARPSPVAQFVIKPGGTLSRVDGDSLSDFLQLTSVPGDKDHLIEPIRILLAKQPTATCLIFVSTRNDTLKIGYFVATHLHTACELPEISPPTPEVAEARRALIKGLAAATGAAKVETQLAACIAAGVGVHHAGLLLEERRLIERAARDRVLNVLVATTTLSAGINIHSVARVIVYSVYRWDHIKKNNVPLQSAVFTQMIGRAGRSSTCHGQAYIVLHTNRESEVKIAIQLSKNDLGTLQSYLHLPGNADRYFLQCVASSILPPTGLTKFLSLTLAAFQDTKQSILSQTPELSEMPNKTKLPPDKVNFLSEKENISTDNFQNTDPKNKNFPNGKFKTENLLNDQESKEAKKEAKKGSILEQDGSFLDEMVMAVQENLVEQGLMTMSDDGKEIRPTRLGLAIAGSSISVEEGRDLLETIERAEEALCLRDEIHLAYLCVSSLTVQQSRPEPYDSPAWIALARDHSHVINLITGMTKGQIDQLQDLPKIFGNGGHRNRKVDLMLDKIYAAAILTDLINEKPINEITKWFRVERGAVQQLQMQSALSASQVAKFCEICGDGLLAATLTKFKQRLNFAAKSELLELMVLPSCTRDVARALYSVGLCNPTMLSSSSMSVEAIASVIAPIGPDGQHMAPTDQEIETSTKILAEANEYAESLARLEDLEQDSLEKVLAAC